jgi:hypothetical protein
MKLNLNKCFPSCKALIGAVSLILIGFLLILIGTVPFFTWMVSSGAG